jgi:hypothetical protein
MTILAIVTLHVCEHISGCCTNVMAAAGDDVIALRAELVRLQELMESKNAQLICKDEVISSKNAQLSCKDEVIARKDTLLARTLEELQHFKAAANSMPPDAADRRCDAEQPSSKRQRMCISSSRSSFEPATPLDRDDILDQIFGFVGGGDHAYTAGVSSRWRDKYLQYCAQISTQTVTRSLSLDSAVC